MNRKFLFFWLRNIAVAFGLIFVAVSLAVLLLLLNAYFGTEIFSLGFLAIISVGFILVMCYKIAQEQYERDQIKSKRLMDTLKQENL